MAAPIEIDRHGAAAHPARIDPGARGRPRPPAICWGDRDGVTRPALSGLVLILGLLLLADFIVVNESLGDVAAVIVAAAVLVAAGAALAVAMALAIRRATDLWRRRGDPVGAALVWSASARCSSPGFVPARREALTPRWGGWWPRCSSRSGRRCSASCSPRHWWPPPERAASRAGGARHRRGGDRHRRAPPADRRPGRCVADGRFGMGVDGADRRHTARAAHRHRGARRRDGGTDDVRRGGDDG